MQNLVKTKSSFGLDLLILTIAIGLFYFLFLGCHSLWSPDEARYAGIAREMFVNNNFVIPKLNGIVFLDKPILYYWLEVSAFKLFGLNEWAVRFWPSIFGVLGCLMAYIVGQRLFNRRVGILAALMLATCPLYFVLAHFANMDLEVSFFISAALFSFIFAINTEKLFSKKVAIFLIYIFAALGLLSKGLIALVFPIAIIGLWMSIGFFVENPDQLRFSSLGRKQLFLINFLGLICFLVIVTPWFVMMQMKEPKFFNYFFINQQFSRYLTADFNNQVPLLFYVPVIFLGSLPWSIFAFQALRDSIKKIFHHLIDHKNELFFLAWFIVVLVFFSIPRSKLVGYILPTIPPLIMLISVYLDSMLQKASLKKLNLAGIIWVAITLGIAGVIFYSNLYTVTEAQYAVIAPYLRLFSVILLLSMVFTLLCLWYESLSTLIINLLLTIVLSMTLLVAKVERFNFDSVYPLAAKLNAVLAKNDEVISFYRYYHELPWYLNRKVLYAHNWFELSKSYDDDSEHTFLKGLGFRNSEPQYLIDENKLKELWNSGKRVYVILPPEYLSLLQSITKSNVQAIYSIDGVAVLVSNL